MLLLLVPVGLATLIGLFVLWPSGEPTRAQEVAATYLPPGTTYPDGEVVSLEEFDCGSPDRPATCARASPPLSGTAELALGSRQPRRPAGRTTAKILGART